MSMGLASSPGWFQSFVLRVCEGQIGVRRFVGDIVVRAGSEHVRYLNIFFARLKNFNNTFAAKPHLGVKVIKFQGNHVTVDGLAPGSGKVRALENMPIPTSVSQLRSLLVRPAEHGCTNYV